MRDMIVNLYAQTFTSGRERELEAEGFLIRKPLIIELDMVQDWVLDTFSMSWALEVRKAFYHTPVTCWITQKDNEVAGFACYDTTAKGFFGPTGVHKKFRGKGIGEVLLFKALASLKESGHAYAIIGGVGPAEFYERKVNAKIIEGSEKNIYIHRLRRNESK